MPSWERLRKTAGCRQSALALRKKGQTVELPDLLVFTSPIHLECVRVPAGDFLLGSAPAQDRGAAKGEQLQHRVYLAEFYIGKYPVTNIQYATFVTSGGNEAPSYWTQERLPAGPEDHPVVYISWHDARAFCGWLSAATGRSFRLPTEAEWEKTARGPHGRIYPWVDRPPTAQHCNLGGRCDASRRRDDTL